MNYVIKKYFKINPLVIYGCIYVGIIWAHQYKTLLDDMRDKDEYFEDVDHEDEDVHKNSIL